MEDYRALLLSSQAELTLMVKINHAKVISRIGFVAEDIKFFEDDISNEIQSRVNENRTNDTECLSESQTRLFKAVSEAGEMIVGTAQDWKVSNDYLSKNIVLNSVHEVQVLVSSFETELFESLAKKNSATELDEILKRHQTSIELFVYNFELHVYDILVDMFVYDIVTKEKNKAMFIKLDEGWQTFQLKGKLIIESLKNCA